MKKFILIGLLIAVIFSGIFIYWKYVRVYSDGIRVGILSKFSKKGNIFKTYEGMMVQPGLRASSGNYTSQMFYFSVEDEALADSLSHVQGNEVEVHYTQYLGALPWRGDKYEGQEGQYIVDQIISVKETGNINPYGL